jgi:hypothetical protein
MTEMPLVPLWVTVFGTIWGLVAPLIGTLLGVWMGYHFSRSQQRNQWIADNRVKEWQELMTALSASFTTIVQTGATLVSADDRLKPAYVLQKLEENVTARTIATQVLVNRVFIAREVRQLGIYTKWSKALAEFDKDHNAGNFGTEYGEITATILAGAQADIERV